MPKLPAVIRLQIARKTPLWLTVPLVRCLGFMLATFLIATSVGQDVPIVAPPLGVPKAVSDVEIGSLPTAPFGSEVQPPPFHPVNGGSVDLPLAITPPAANETGDGKTRRNRYGDELVQNAARRLSSHKTVTASLRQTVNLFGQSVVGNGAYHQSRRGSDLLLRLDLKLQLKDRAATFQQICDGRFLWRFRDSPDIQNLGAFKQELSRVDLDVVRRATVSGKNGETLPIANFSGIGYGGLPQLLEQLVHNFTFDVPQSGDWQGIPIFVLQGAWYEPSLRRAMTRYNEAKPGSEPLPKEFSRLLAKLPAQFPHQVTLVLGKDDLFPYRIVFRRQIENEASTGIIVKSNMRPVVTLDLFRVQYDSPIAQSQFVRQAGDLPVRDATAEYLVRHGLIYREASHPQSRGLE